MAGTFYSRTGGGTRTALTLRGYRQADGTYQSVTARDATDGADSPTSTSQRTTILFGASPGIRIGLTETEAAIGRLPLVRRYSSYNIPGTGNAERRKYYWHEERVRTLLDGDVATGRTGAEVARDLVNALPAGSYVTAGHENDNDSNLPAALRVLVTACLNRSDGGVRVAPIGRGFELRNTAAGATEDARISGMVTRMLPTAAANDDNTMFQMQRVHSATGKKVGCIGVDLYNGKNASNGTATDLATNGQELTPWQVYGPCAKLGKAADLPWMVGETAYMVSLYTRLKRDGTVDPLYQLGNKSDQEMADYWRECLAFWKNPATYYTDHQFPGCVPPEAMCYWYSYNGDVKPEPNNFILDDFPLTAQAWKDIIAVSRL